MPFRASVFFFCLFVYFISSMSEKCFPLRPFFIQGNMKVTWGKIVWTRSVGHGGHAIFGQKLLNTQHSVSQCACKSLFMKWANMLKREFKNNSLMLNAASHNNASWYTDTDGFLENSPSGGSLYCVQGAHPSEDNPGCFGVSICVGRHISSSLSFISSLHRISKSIRGESVFFTVYHDHSDPKEYVWVFQFPIAT